VTEKIDDRYTLHFPNEVYFLGDLCGKYFLQIAALFSM
jgi:hypothetical protein